ncbi:copper homeostasis protein [Grosmannia clavigera kw1407]|uniref:Copper homeostasis protein cutC homolog n=1 Tax=Grosmannia clavigera (strain kw1407 / UAMH 11150) TaxID=655863 RepID=F0XEN6_GROCL|nr:copper homeostasis protein [Grosmannia clavigera kw1407]EFX04625.1 copper homeostasis protein [Grosmannia clavigera kw1407]
MSVTTFEVPVFSAEAAGTAVFHGATRLEINRGGSYAVGGLTPTLEEVRAAAASLGGHSVPLRVMIRPRGKPLSGRPDFLYTDEELDEMRTCIGVFVAAGLLRPDRGDGFVFGVLEEAEETETAMEKAVRIDVARCQMLVQAASPFACVLHRAFDEVMATMGADGGIAAAIGCGFVGILTAGGVGAEGAMANLDMLRKLVSRKGTKLEEVDGETKDMDTLEVIIGGGVRSRNLPELMTILSCSRRPVAFHSSCLGAENESETVDGNEAAKIVELLRVGDGRRK